MAMNDNENVAEVVPPDFLGPKEEQRLVRIIDWHLMPIILISFGLQSMDKISLAFGAVLGMNEGLHLVGQQYNWANSIYDVGFLIASYPISLGFVKFPLGKYLSVLILLWGIILALHSVSSGFAGLMVLRALLGVCGSGNASGLSLITCMWYTPKEHMSRHSLWFTGNSIGMIIGAFIGYGVINYAGTFAKWKILFLVFGLTTVVWAILLWFYLPDSPSNARFLKPSDREIASLRVKRFQHTTQTRKWDRGQFVEALKDPHSWWWFIFSVIACLPMSGVYSFSTLVIEGFGYDASRTILIGLPSYAFQLVTVALLAILTSKVRNTRLIALTGLYILAVSGVLVVMLIPVERKLVRLAGLWMVMSVAPLPVLLSLLASNTAGFTKKSTLLAVVFIGFSVGNIVGPQCFISSEKPKYTTAYITILTCFTLAMVLPIVLRFYLGWRNKRRDMEQGIQVELDESREVDLRVVAELGQVDETDITNRSFRYEL